MTPVILFDDCREDCMVSLKSTATAHVGPCQVQPVGIGPNLSCGMESFFLSSFSVRCGMSASLISLAPELVCMIVKELPIENARDLLASCQKIHDNGHYAFTKKCFH